jgi:hypothetical protein
MRSRKRERWGIGGYLVPTLALAAARAFDARRCLLPEAEMLVGDLARTEGGGSAGRQLSVLPQ